MKLNQTLLLLLCLSTVEASARIGETKSQLIARYGEPVVVETDGLAFRYAGYFIAVQLHLGVCNHMGIVKLSGENQVAIPPIEIDRLKRVFGGGREWEKDETDGTALASITTDGELILTYSNKDGRLDISAAKVAIAAADAALVADPQGTRMQKALMDLARTKTIEGDGKTPEEIRKYFATLGNTKTAILVGKQKIYSPLNLIKYRELVRITMEVMPEGRDSGVQIEEKGGRKVSTTMFPGGYFALKQKEIIPEANAALGLLPTDKKGVFFGALVVEINNKYVVFVGGRVNFFL